MAKGYWIAHVDVHNEEGYKAYVATNNIIFKQIRRRVFFVRGGKIVGAPKGRRARRNVVIEFPELRGGAGLLPLAGISGEYQGPAGRMRSPTSSSSRAIDAL